MQVILLIHQKEEIYHRQNRYSMKPIHQITIHHKQQGKTYTFDVPEGEYILRILNQKMKMDKLSETHCHSLPEMDVAQNAQLK